MRAAMIALLLAGAVVLGSAGMASADTGDDLIDELMCPSASYSRPLANCETPEAVWMREFIRAKVAEGWSRQRIVDTLVRQYGERILMVPPKEGFSLTAWITPFATIFGGVAVVGFLLTRWLRQRRWHEAYLDAEIARAVDESDMKRYEARLRKELEQFE